MKLEVYKGIMELLRDIIEPTEFKNHVFAVGGCERDKRLGNEIKDIDLVVRLPNGGIKFAEYLHKIGASSHEPVVYEHFGTAMFRLDQFPDIELEAVQTRKECYHDMDSRNPETAYGTIWDDCKRRDFTVNAFYYDISQDKELDLNGSSTKDLENKVIRACWDPDIIFNEDPLRVLRMVRFAARLDFKIEDKTFEAAKRWVNRLTIISKERIQDEFIKMCSVRYFVNFRSALATLMDLGAFKYIFPSLDGLKHLEVYNLIERMSTFWSDMFDPTNEEIVAALLYNSETAEKEMKDLKFSNDFIKEVMFLISSSKKFSDDFFNDWPDDSPEIDLYSHEKFMFRLYMYVCKNHRRMKAVVALNDDLRFFFMSDRNEYGRTDFNEYECDGREFYDYELPVNGDDVMEIFEIGPSAKVGEILEECLEFVLRKPQFKSRENLLNYMRMLKKENAS